MKQSFNPSVSVDIFKSFFGGKDWYDNIGDFISQSIIPNVLMVAGLLLFFLIILGGFTLITNAGNPDKQKEGAKTLSYALLGFVIIFTSYWIMQILGIITGIDLLDFSSFNRN
jgi:uncharacterized membrane protein